MIRDYHARGKLLLTAEYVVMQGALALACPTRRGQSMYLAPYQPARIQWKAFTPRGEVWLEAEWTWMDVRQDAIEPGNPLKKPAGFKPLNEVALNNKSSGAAVNRLETWLTHALFISYQTNPEHFREQSDRVKSEGISVETYLEFEREWGLGSSSTLISLIAQWWGCQPMVLHAATQGGSGYDQACATAGGPIFYQLMGEEVKYSSGQLLQSNEDADSDDGFKSKHNLTDFQATHHIHRSNEATTPPLYHPIIQSAAFQPSFHEHLLFVYTGKKQSTDHSIRQFWMRSDSNENMILEISECTRQLATATDLKTFMEIMYSHEQIMSGLLGEVAVQTTMFSSFPGQTKSLGAWGGDFILAATSEPELARKYLSDSGFPICFAFHELLLCPPTTAPQT